MTKEEELLEQIEIIDGIKKTPMNFQILEKQKKEISDILKLHKKKVTIKLWRSIERSDWNWTIQNIQVYLDDELIIDSDTNNTWSCDENSWYMYLVINYTDNDIRISTNDKKDKRYIKKNQSYVGNIALPKKYQKKWLAQKIYQELANTLQIEIVRWDNISWLSQSFWKKHISFEPILQA